MDLITSLETEKDSIICNISFIDSTLRALKQDYDEKVAHGKNEKAMFELAWDIKEVEDLNDCGRQLMISSSTLIDKLSNSSYNRITDNFAQQLTSWIDATVSFVKRLVKYKRVAATHVMVILISPEERCTKPYALPVQCIAYKGIKDKEVRQLCNNIVKEMKKRGMKVAGFTTNGEFNSLRAKGNSRPLSIFEIRSQARSKVSRLTEKTMLGMLTPKVDADGCVKAEISNPAIGDDLLKEILLWKSEGCSITDIVNRLRNRTVPNGYKYHTWKEGLDETFVDKLKSIIAQLEYKHRVIQWDKNGVQFRKHLHVPEIHPITEELFCEREDEGHVFKRIANTLRQGRVKGLHLERFVEALSDPSAELTYPALTGIRKQSVEDVERLFGIGVINFMEKNGYKEEEKYLRVVRNWRRAVDERGLSNEQREQFYADYLDYIKTDLIPWNSGGNIDLSQLEVNRPLNDIRGLTRECLIALAADIESRQFRRKFLSQKSLKPEHPRASTTDDVECFFSVLRDTVGKDFTLKQVYFEWRKICMEFTKRSDPTLPFYYFTSSHQRFYEGEMPSFDEPISKSKKKRVPQRELIGAIGRRVSLPVRGSLSVRAQFHNTPVDLPPTPDATFTARILHEHSY